MPGRLKPKPPRSWELGAWDAAQNQDQALAQQFSMNFRQIFSANQQGDRKCDKCETLEEELDVIQTEKGSVETLS